MDSKVLTVIDECYVMPAVKENEIQREYYQTIDEIFKPGNNVVVIEGESGCGATTLVSQYARHYPNDTIALFVVGSQRMSYSQEQIFDVLGRQIAAYLKKDMNDIPLVGENEFNQLLIILARTVRWQKPVTFVIDGLAQLPQDEEGTIKKIIQGLPTVTSGKFRYLLTGSEDIFRKYFDNSVRLKPWQIPRFTLSETAILLRDHNLSQTEISEVQQACQGSPGKIESIKRLLSSGFSVKDIFASKSGVAPDFVELEWGSLKDKTEVEEIALAIICFGQIEFTIEKLANIIKCDKSQIFELASRALFLKLIPGEEKLEFVSELHRKYCEAKLGHKKQEAIALIVRQLIENPSDNESLRLLPAYYEQQRNYEDLLKYVDTSYYNKLLSVDRSIQSLKQKATLAVSAAISLDDFMKIYQFGLSSSVIGGLERVQTGRAEVEALLAMKEYGQALERAARATTAEDKLNLYVIIAKSRRKNNVACDLLPEIERLTALISGKNIGERAFEIASDLIVISPELAFSLIDGSSENQTEALTKKFAAATLASSFMKGRVVEINAGMDTTEKQNPEYSRNEELLKQFAHQIYLSVGNFSAADVISHVDKLGIDAKVKMLREWVKVNFKKQDAVNVVDYILSNIISETKYSPKVVDLLDLSIVLAKIDDKEKLISLHRSFKSQLGLIKDKTTSEDLVQLEMSLAIAQEKIDESLATNSVVDLILKVMEIEDVSTRINCIAWLLVGVNKMNQEGQWKVKDKIDEMLLHYLENDLDVVLNNTAGQVVICKSALKALAEVMPEKAIDTCSRFNTCANRDLAYTVVAVNLSGHGDFVKASIALNKISDQNAREVAVVRMLESIERRADRLDPSASKILGALIGCENYDQFCEGAIVAIRLLSKWVGVLDAFHSKLINSFKERVTQIDDECKKIKLIYEMSSALAVSDVECAKSFFDLAEDERKTSSIENYEAQSIRSLCISLTIRSGAWLIPFEGLKSDYLDRIGFLIDKDNSPIRRVKMWADLAMRASDKKNHELCRHIFKGKIRPILEDVSLPKYQKKVAIIVGFPVMFIFSEAEAIDYLKDLGETERNKALHNTVEWIIKGCSLLDPYQESNTDGTALDYDEILKACSAASKLSIDYMVFSAINYIVDCVLGKSKSHLTIQHKQNIHDKMMDIISSKLPDMSNITHDGYVIAAKASVARIANSPGKADWEMFVSQVSDISNAADRAATYGLVAKYIPTKFSEVGNVAWNLAKTAISEIPSDYDNVSRSSWIATLAKDKDIALAKEFIKNAYSLTSKLKDENFACDSRRRIIDLASNVDESFANKLVDEFENDEVRIRSRLESRQQLAIENARNDVIKNKGEKISEKILPEVAWSHLGRLNAHRVSPLPRKDLEVYLKKAALLPIEMSFPVYSWIIENIGVRLHDTLRINAKSKSDTSIMELMLERNLMAAELADSLLERLRSDKNLQGRVINEGGENFVVRSGLRNEAFDFIAGWLASLPEYGEIIICDPYFKPESIEVLHFISGIRRDASLIVLTSMEGRSIDQDEYYKAWKRITDDPQVNAQIIFVGRDGDGKSPIHDRWWLHCNSGLRVGTSVDSIGGWRLSEISLLDDAQSKAIASEITPFISMKQRTYENVKLKYASFFMGD